MDNETKISFTSKEKTIRRIWLVLHIFSFISIAIFFLSEDSSEVPFFFLLSAIEFIGLWYCAYKKNGTRLLKFYYRFLYPLNLLNLIKNAPFSQQVLELDPSFLGSLFFIPVKIWVTYLMHEMNLSKKKYGPSDAAPTAPKVSL